MNTTHLTKQEIKRDWIEMDAGDAPVGRMATQIATYLMGKHKPSYSPHNDGGDFVVVVNSKNLYMTGGKEKKKIYYRHSGYPGGFKEIAFKKYKAEQPEKIIQHAVRGMLPDNRLRKPRMRRLRIYETDTHPYTDKIKK